MPDPTRAESLPSDSAAKASGPEVTGFVLILLIFSGMTWIPLPSGVFPLAFRLQSIPANELSSVHNATNELTLLLIDRSTGLC
jgi:hypothetical protein